MSTARWIALRYLRTRKRQFAAFITWVSVAGLTLGVLVLTVVVSVMNGFDAELKTRILGTVPHLLLLGKSTADEDVVRLSLEPAIVQKFNFFTGAGMVTRNGRVNPVSIYGIDEAGSVALEQIANNMTYGNLKDVTRHKRGIVLGSALAAHLGLLPGDSVALVISEPSAIGVQPKIHRFELVGTFEIGVELDASLVLIGISSLGSNLDSIGSFGSRRPLPNRRRTPPHPLSGPGRRSELSPPASGVLTARAGRDGGRRPAPRVRCSRLREARPARTVCAPPDGAGRGV